MMHAFEIQRRTRCPLFLTEMSLDAGGKYLYLPIHTTSKGLTFYSLLVRAFQDIDSQFQAKSLYSNPPCTI